MLGTFHENAPECATDLALGESREINMAGETAVDERLGEFVMVDAILIELSDEYRKIVMAVYTGGFN